MTNDRTRRGIVGWLIRHPFLGASILAVLLLAAVAALLDRSASNGIQRRIAEIRSRGEPASAADLLAECSPLPDEENLTTALIEAAKPLATLEIPQDKAAVLPYFGSMYERPTLKTLTADQLDAANWFLDRYADILRDVHGACRLPTGWHGVRWTEPITHTPFGELVHLRHAWKLISLEVLAAAAANDQSRAGECLKKLFRCGHAFDKNRAVPDIALIHRRGIAEAAVTQTVDVINHCGLPPACLVALQTELEHCRHPATLVGSIMVARVTYMDLWIHGRKTPVSLFDFQRMTPARRFKGEQAGLDAYTALIAALQRPEDEVFSAFKSWQSSTVIPSDCPSLGISVALSSDLITREFRLLARSRALQTAIACERFRLSQGRWPSELSELVPDYMNAIPNDLFDGQPLRYQMIPEGIKVWSIGPDGRDDGGDIDQQRPAAGTEAIEPKDVGWLIMHPELRAAYLSDDGEQ